MPSSSEVAYRFHFVDLGPYSRLSLYHLIIILRVRVNALSHIFDGGEKIKCAENSGGCLRFRFRFQNAKFIHSTRPPLAALLDFGDK